MSGFFVIASIIGIPVSIVSLAMNMSKPGNTIKTIGSWYFTIAWLCAGSMMLEKKEMIEPTFTVKHVIYNR